MAVVDTVYETSGHLILKANENHIRVARFTTRHEPPGWREKGGWTAGWKRGRVEEVRQGRKEEARQGGKEGRRKRG